MEELNITPRFLYDELSATIVMKRLAKEPEFEKQLCALIKKLLPKKSAEQAVSYFTEHLKNGNPDAMDYQSYYVISKTLCVVEEYKKSEEKALREYQSYGEAMSGLSGYQLKWMFETLKELGEEGKRNTPFFNAVYDGYLGNLKHCKNAEFDWFKTLKAAPEKVGDMPVADLLGAKPEKGKANGKVKD